MSNTYFYKDRPIFGMDIGFSSMKIMQLSEGEKQAQVVGYGVNRFDSNAIKDGVIVDPESVAKSALDLFKNHIVGNITTRRVALSVPAMRTFNRPVKLPLLGDKELQEAVRLEAEQYIPMPIDDLYLDFTVLRKTDKEADLFVVAVPKKIVDSHLTLARVLGLDAVALETTIGASSRLFYTAELNNDVPTILIDFGSKSTDVTIFDKTLVVTGTVTGGGDDFTAQISQKLGVTLEEADTIKTKYGLRHSKKQEQILATLQPMLEELLKETRKMVRYYEERYGPNAKIQQIVTMGGGANIPGLSDYMTDNLRLPVRMSDPWLHIGFSKLQPPSTVERSMYVTVAGLALIKPQEIFAP